MGAKDSRTTAAPKFRNTFSVEDEQWEFSSHHLGIFGGHCGAPYKFYEFKLKEYDQQTTIAKTLLN
jgi:hypothetical protein